jgi:uncharacterized membrane protein YgdD (TMEM256/DUF423 family)
MALGELSGDARLLVRVGLALWLLAALTAVWELLALQPIAQASSFAFAHGAATLLVGLAWDRLAPARSWTAWALVLGAVVHVGALMYAAAKGLLAVQLLDPRADARMVLYVRGAAHVSSVAGLLGVLLRALRS